MTLQQQSQSWASLEMSLSNHSCKLKSIEEQMNSMQQQLQLQVTGCAKSHEPPAANHEAPAMTNISVGARVLPSVLPTVVVKLKRDGQSRDDTVKRVKESIVGSERLVHDSHCNRNGDLVISCVNATDTIAVKNMIRDRIGDEFDVSLPEIKKPRAKIISLESI